MAASTTDPRVAASPPETGVVVAPPRTNTLQPGQPAVQRASAPPVRSITSIETAPDDEADSTFVGRAFSLGDFSKSSKPTDPASDTNVESHAPEPAAAECAAPEPAAPVVRASGHTGQSSLSVVESPQPDTYADFGLRHDDDPFADFSA